MQSNSPDELNKTFKILDYRIRKLENKVCGSQNITENSFVQDDIVSTLSTLGSKLGNALSTRDRMMMVMKRLGELERYLDPTYGETSELSDNAKADLVVSQAENLQNMYQQLNSLNSLKQCLASQEIADSLSAQNAELVQLWQNHCETDQSVKEQSDHISEMLESYNNIILTLTETFVKMDNIITKAEMAAIPKKVID